MILFNPEYTLFSIISLEIGENISEVLLGDYRGNIIKIFSSVRSALSIYRCIALHPLSLCSLFLCPAWFGFCHL